jgi:hypothetical protein
MRLILNHLNTFRTIRQPYCKDMNAVRRRVLWKWLQLMKYGEVWMFSFNLSSYLIIRPRTPLWLPFARDARGRSIVQKPGGFFLPSWSWIMSVMRSARRSHLSAALFQWFMIRSYLVAAANKRRDFTRAYMKQPALCRTYVGPEPYNILTFPFDFIYSRFIFKMDSYISKYQGCHRTFYTCLLHRLGFYGRGVGVRFPARARDVSLLSTTIPALGPTQPPIRWVQGLFHGE